MVVIVCIRMLWARFRYWMNRDGGSLIDAYQGISSKPGETLTAEHIRAALRLPEKDEP